MTKEIYNYLVMHILDMQKNKIKIISRYSMDYEKYTTALDILNGYIRSVENCINKAYIAKGDHKAPLVIIGSTVGIRDASGQMQYYTVTTPDMTSSVSGGVSRAVSCFGGLGRELLLKEEGEQIELGDKLNGVIADIQYDMRL